MLPMTITIEGLLKYREKQTFDFTGQTLWLLCGPNGIGKSTVFDALTYALYGQHRGGAQKPERLISQGADYFTVTFDCMIENVHYRIHRTCSPTKKTCSISTVSAEGYVDVIPTTIAVDGFDKWIIAHMGMDYNAFTACVMLRQGESDRLLDVIPSKRHEIIGQVINIQQYAVLEQRAKQHHADEKTMVTHLRAELARLGVVTNAEFAEADTAVAVTERKHRHLATERDALLRRDAAVRRWNDLTTEQESLIMQLAQATQALAQTEVIEQAAARHAVLTRDLPPLQTIVRLQEQLNETSAACDAATHNMQRIMESHRVTSAEYDDARQRLTQHRTAQTEQQNQERAAHQQQAALAPHIAMLARRTQVHEKLHKLDSDLARYPADLDEQLIARRASIAEAQAAQQDSPPLARFARARAQWQQAQQDGQDAAAVLASIQTNIPAGMTAETYVGQCRDTVTTTKNERDRYQQRLIQLARLDGLATCEMCGQPLTAEHLHHERARLQALVSTANQQYQLQQVQHLAAQEMFTHYQQQQGKVREAQSASQREAAAAREAFDDLSTPLQARIATEGDVLAALPLTGYPNASDVTTLQRLSVQLGQLRQQLTSLEDAKQARADLAAQRKPLAEDLGQIDHDFPPQRIAAIEAEAHTLHEHIETVRRASAELTATITAAEQHEAQLDVQIAEMRAALVNAKSAEAHQQGIYERLHGDLATAIRVCPASWNPAEVDAACVTALEAERVSLQEAPLARQKLQEARSTHQRLSERRTQVQQDLAAIDEHARIALAEYQRRCEMTELEYALARQAMQEAQERQQTRRQLRQQRMEYESRLQTANQQADLWGQLAQMLSREHLQYHLLKRAEEAIVAYANMTLAAISGYALRLEVPADAEHILDLVVFDESVGPKPIEVKLQSGSQKFRVALSLAMGVGRYVTAGRQTPEAVFIDEGFGSLDQDGRQQMISAITDLTSQLQRIILVSHQEEFAQAFPHAYEVYADGNTSRARYVMLDDRPLGVTSNESSFALVG